MSHTYKKNYLKQVIFRVDFNNVDFGSFDNFKLHKKTEFTNTTKTQQNTGGLEFDVGSGEVTKNLKKIDIWQFKDPKTDNKFEVGPEYCLLEYTTYVDSSVLTSHIDKLIKPLLSTFDVDQILRIGLRYINQVDLTSVKKLKDWNKYISDELLSGTFYLQTKIGAPIRSISQAELKVDSLISAQLIYGIWNDQYPSPITNNSYILDIDTFTRSPISTEDSEITESVKSLNKAAELIFEQSIKDALRKDMNNA